MASMSLVDQVKAHVRAEAPLGVYVIAFRSGSINLLSWRRGWWVEIKPAIAEMRLACGHRWQMTEYRPGGIAAERFACGDWEVITWLWSLWRTPRFSQQHGAPILARIKDTRNSAGGQSTPLEGMK